jgi:hypothetical protein
MFWVRKEQVTTIHPGLGSEVESAVASVGGMTSNGSANGSTTGSSSGDDLYSASDDGRTPATGAARPPSYSSDDGVSYVLEARPRSIAPPPPVAYQRPQQQPQQQQQQQQGGGFFGMRAGWI